MRTVSFVVPCYNSAEYMDTCIDSLLLCGKDIEIIIVDDGSTKDNTKEKALEWQSRYPNVIRAHIKENGGHGSAVNAGLELADALYFKVVDSDDWLDASAMQEVMGYLRAQLDRTSPTDMVIGNYVYEKKHENKQTVMKYENVFPEHREISWDEIGRFKISQYLLMHSVIYRTDLLRDIHLQLPEHCFYVDNIFVYVPLPNVRTMYYINADMYRYFIGREDQSVNEKIMLSRIDQQLRITRIMIDSVNLYKEVSCKKLISYMENYVSMMMCISSIFLRMEKSAENETKRFELWNYLREKNEMLYRRVRYNILNVGTNLPTAAGRAFGLFCYHIAQKIFRFN